MIFHPRVTGAVLAGGRATRMGGMNKALLPLGPGGSGTPMGRILEVFSGRFAGCVLVTSPGAEAEGGPYAGLPVALTCDRIPGCGPLGGLHAALAAVTTPMAFVCGCDMPSLSGPLLDFMARRAREERPLVPVRAGRPEPLHAIYPAAVLPHVERALGDGVRMMLDFLSRLPVDYLAEEDFAGIEGAAGSFYNINTPADLERLQQGQREVRG